MSAFAQLFGNNLSLLSGTTGGALTFFITLSLQGSFRRSLSSTLLTGCTLTFLYNAWTISIYFIFKLKIIT